MLYFTPGLVLIGFDGTGLLLLFAVFVLCSAALIARWKKRTRVAVALFALTSSIALVQLSRGVMTPPDAWGVMLAAIEQSTGNERASRIRDVQAHWRYGNIPALDWYLIANRWQVCNGMWPQDSCANPPGPYQASGIAREILDEFMGTPYFPPTKKWANSSLKCNTGDLI